MSRRLQLVVPEPVGSQLDELAANAQEATATIAAQMLRGAVAEAAAAGHVRPLRLVQSSRPRAEMPHAPVGLSHTAATVPGASRCGAP